MSYARTCEQSAAQLRSGTRPWWYSGEDADAAAAYYDEQAARYRSAAADARRATAELTRASRRRG